MASWDIVIRMRRRRVPKVPSRQDQLDYFRTKLKMTKIFIKENPDARVEWMIEFYERKVKEFEEQIK